LNKQRGNKDQDKIVMHRKQAVSGPRKPTYEQAGKKAGEQKHRAI
jgi:hypothetical protein